MGWTFGYGERTKQEARDCILADFTYASDRGTGKVLAHRTVGNHLWLVCEDTSPGRLTRCVVLCLMAKRDGMWGHKAMDEAMGPYYYDCPEALLAYKRIIPESVTKYSDAWRLKVAAHHAAKRQKRAAR